MGINPAARERLCGYFPKQNDFEVLLGEMLSLDVPISFIEGYYHNGHAVKHDYPSAPKVIMSAVGWYFDEAFKQWAAGAAEQGTLLLGMQHGGNYGCLACNAGEDHEIAIADRYYTWGWERSDIPGKVIPRSAAKLAGRKPLGASNKKDGILFVATTSFRYFREFPILPRDFSEYLVWQRRFLTSFSPTLLPMLRVRLHREDHGWDMKKRWREICPDIRFEDWSTPLTRSLKNCRLYVSDHLATTYIEALAADKPTILFWDPAANELRPEAQQYFDHLRHAGILFDSPEAAAEMVNTIYGDVETWWNNPVRQAARRAFCDRFARTSSQAVREWLDEFNGIAQDAGMTLTR
jgi:putative transferase (TIGR04331 family)